MTTTPSLKFFQPTVAATLAIVIACVISVPSAQAVPYVVTLQQVGFNVVATGSGAIDLGGLSSTGSGGFTSGMVPSSPYLVTGVSASADEYRHLNGPANFGSGAVFISASSSTGGLVGIEQGFLFVPSGYVSNTLVSDSSTYNNQSFSTIGITPGTYVWTWGTGADQSFTIDAVAPAVPDSGSTFGLLLAALGALFGVSRFRSLRLA